MTNDHVIVGSSPPESQERETITFWSQQLHHLDFNEKKLVGNYTWMLHVVLNKSLKQHLTKQYLYAHLPPISQTIQRQPRQYDH